MKTIYFIRHAKAANFEVGESDFERSLSKKGIKDIKTIGSYLKLRSTQADIILSSCAIRAQDTALKLSSILSYQGNIEYFEHLYKSSIEEIIEIIQMQENESQRMIIIGHHPYLTELVNQLSPEHISKIPSMGVVCMQFDTNNWNDITTVKGNIDFFIFPKQFKYYMPKQIRTSMDGV